MATFLAFSLLWGCDQDPQAQKRPAVKSKPAVKEDLEANPADDLQDEDSEPSKSDQEGVASKSKKPPAKSTKKSSSKNSGTTKNQPEAPEVKNKDSGDDLDEEEDDSPVKLMIFQNDIYPYLKENCASCHVGPRIEVATRGPMTIYNEDQMAGFLFDGSSSFEESYVVRKLTGELTHAGGDVCKSLTRSPCKQLKSWWDAGKDDAIEPSVTSTSTLTSELNEPDTSGAFHGYAGDKSDPTEVVTVEFYLGGSKEDGGTKVGEAKADQLGFDGGLDGNHAFKFMLDPADFTSGEEATIYAYATMGGKAVALKNSPLKFTAYQPQGQALFQDSSNLFNGCQNCHGAPQFATWYPSLISPPPHKGGTATSNLLYQRASGVDHPGGNQCGGGNLCDFITEWWQAEFQ